MRMTGSAFLGKIREEIITYKNSSEDLFVSDPSFTSYLGHAILPLVLKCPDSHSEASWSKGSNRKYFINCSQDCDIEQKTLTRQEWQSVNFRHWLWKYSPLPVLLCNLKVCGRIDLNLFIKMNIYLLLSVLLMVITSIKSEEDGGFSAQPRLLQGGR